METKSVWYWRQAHAWLVSVRSGATVEEGNEIVTRVASGPRKAKQLAEQLAEEHGAATVNKA